VDDLKNKITQLKMKGKQTVNSKNIK